MADSLDDAQRVNDVYFEAAMSNSVKKELPAKGRCYNCDEPLEADKKYCDSDCRKDHEQRMRFKNLH